MRTLIVLLTAFPFLAAANAPTTQPAPMTVRVERVRVKKPIAPAATTIPADATRLDSIETLAAPNSDYHCVAAAQGIRTELSGHLNMSTDGYGRIGINYRRQIPDGGQQIQSTLMLKPGQTFCMGFFGPPAGGGEVLFVTLDTPAPQK